jgi:hypothetical protein
MKNKENSKQKKKQEQQCEHQQNSLLARVISIYPSSSWYSAGLILSVILH